MTTWNTDKRTRNKSLPTTILGKRVLLSGIIVSASAAMSAAVVADVKSLTSDEMTETYIKDSTIIVTPGKRKKNQAADNKRKLTTLTISPGKAEKSEADEHYEFEQMTSQQASRIDSAMTFADIEAAQQNLIRQQQTAMMPAPDIKLIMPERPMPDIPGFEEFLESGVTERNFNYTPLLGGSGIEIERVDNQLIMGFGDLKGVDTIQVPRAIDEGPVQLTPRPGGGFDLVIEIPQN